MKKIIHEYNVREKLRIVHLSKCDINGGAFIAAYRLHKALQVIGVDSWMIVDKKITDDPTVVGPKGYFQKVSSIFSGRLDTLPTKLISDSDNKPASYAWVPDRIASKVALIKPDLINLHWINDGFIRIESLKKFHNIPIVWTLHDMWPFCGVKHYSSDDLRYQYGYSSDNRPKDEHGFDFNRWVWQRKKKVLKSFNNLTVVAPSVWMYECAKQSVIFRDREIKVIPYGVNQEIFKPVDHTFAKNNLGLPLNKKLILFGAINGILDKRKGFDLLQAAIKQLRQKRNDIELVVFGSSKPEVEYDMGCKCHYMGQIQNEKIVSLIYNTADVFVVPSREDNLPNTIIEALSCGIPTGAFNIGGISDMIEHQKNGYLAKPFDIQDLADGINWVLQANDNWTKLSLSARAKVISHFNFELQAKRYLNVYESALKA